MAKSIVGAYAPVFEKEPRDPIYKRLRSGYSIHDPKSGLVLGEIQPEKKGEGWRMSFGGERWQAHTLGTLFAMAGVAYRLRGQATAVQPPRPAPSETLLSAPVHPGFWRRLLGEGPRA